MNRAGSQLSGHHKQQSRRKHMNETVERLHPLEISVLIAFREKDRYSNEALAKASGLPLNQLRTAVEWLLLKGLISSHETGIEETASLTALGRDIAENGFPESRMMAALAARPEGIPVKDLPEACGMDQATAGSTMGSLKKNGAISIDRGLAKAAESCLAERLEERRRIFTKLAGLGRANAADLSDEEMAEIRAGFKKRSPEKGFFRIEERPLTDYEVTDSGRELLPHLKVRTVINQITPQILASGKWREAELRKYDISLNAPKLTIGKKHPYRQFIEGVRGKLVGLGFKEMSGPLVESEFWDMDALFMPQFHSARNIHDVYFVKSRDKADISEPFLSNVKAAHENGERFGSRGWGYAFDMDRTRRLILRSQGTAISARTLSSSPNNPGKYFAVARCFRYDQIDATHGTDFFQVEGIAVDEDINFRKLLGLLKLFAKEIAQTEEIVFKPAYFPFTEPSVEMHGKHPTLGWIELGGAGIFRKEVTLPLGVKAPVIAWGLGIDRMAMVSLGISDIRQLFSHDLEFIRDSKVV